MQKQPQQKNQQPSKGFIIVASRTYNFYRYAINLAESIKDYFPEAKICLVTEQKFCDGREKIADDLIYCGSDIREKLWALSKTPYDITMYLDADAEIQHQDICTVFDQLNDHDMVFANLTKENEEVFAIRQWDGGEFTLCGGVVLYDIRNPLVKSFMEDWHKYYQLQRTREWWPIQNEDGTPDYTHCPEKLYLWDQTTLWGLTEKTEKYKQLKIGIFEDPMRWNYFSRYLELPKEKQPKCPPIVFHLSNLAIKG